MAASEVLVLFTWLCAPAPTFKLLLQSKHISLLDSAIKPPLGAGIRLGLAQRERVRNPRSASDDVIFDVRNVGRSLVQEKLKKTIGRTITCLTRTSKGYHMQSATLKSIQSFKHVGATKSLAGSFRWVLGIGTRK